jgi:hypothetical protein
MAPTQSNYLDFLKKQNPSKKKFKDMSFLPKVMQEDLENSKSEKSHVSVVEEASAERNKE